MPNYIDMNKVNTTNNIEEEKFRLLLEQNLDSILLKKYNISPDSDFIKKSEVKTLIDQAINNIKNIYLTNRIPNKHYEIGDIAYLPYSNNYYLECVTIDNRVNNGKTNPDEILGLPEFYNDNNEVIDPTGQLFEDGGITWKIYAKYDGFDNNKDITIETKLVEATDIVLKGLTRIQDGTLVQDYNNSNPKATEDILQLADIRPALKFKNNTEVYEDQDVVAKGIAVGKDATISAVTIDNHIGIRGNSDYEKNDPSKGGIVFGNWGITGVGGDANDLVVYTARNGAIVPKNSPARNGESNVNETDIGKQTMPFNTLYVKRIQAEIITANEANITATNSISNVKAIPVTDSVIPLIGYNSSKTTKLNYSNSLVIDTVNNKIIAPTFEGTADNSTKIKVNSANNISAYLLGVKTGDINSGFITPTYNNNVYISGNGELRANKFIGTVDATTLQGLSADTTKTGQANKIAVYDNNTRVANSTKVVVTKDNSNKLYILGGNSSSTVNNANITPSYNENVYITNGTITATRFNGKINGALIDGAVPSSVLPPSFVKGMIIDWWGDINARPAGWYPCDGGTYTVNGVTTTVPDLRDRFIVGAGKSYAFKATGGEPTVTLTLNQIPEHNHVAVKATGHNHTITATANGGHSHTVAGNTAGAGTHNHTVSGNFTVTLQNHYHTVGHQTTNNNGYFFIHGGGGNTGLGAPALPGGVQPWFWNGSGHDNNGVARWGDNLSTSYPVNGGGTYSQVSSISGNSGSVNNHAHSLNITSSNVDNHTHTITCDTKGEHTHTINNAGGGKSHENRPPFYALYKLIFLGI